MGDTEIDRCFELEVDVNLTTLTECAVTFNYDP